MLKVVYDTFGLHYKMALSTRPEEKLGDDAMWDQAEGALQGALDESGHDWEVSQHMALTFTFLVSSRTALGLAAVHLPLPHSSHDCLDSDSHTCA